MVHSGKQAFYSVLKTGSFHDYRVSITGGKSSFFSDGNFIDTLSLAPAVSGSRNGVASIAGACFAVWP
jgi:hypothetical protein